VAGRGSTLAGMSVTVDLPEELLEALRAEAARRHVSIDVVIAESVSEHLGPRRHLAIFGVGASGGTRGRAADADELLADGFGRD
jgi:hypothetical protein